MVCIWNEASWSGPHQPLHHLYKQKEIIVLGKDRWGNGKCDSEPGGTQGILFLWKKRFTYLSLFLLGHRGCRQARGVVVQKGTYALYVEHPKCNFWYPEILESCCNSCPLYWSRGIQNFSISISQQNFSINIKHIMLTQVHQVASFCWRYRSQIVSAWSTGLGVQCRTGWYRGFT